MRSLALLAAILAPLAACVPPPTTQFIPSQKSAVELRSMQSRAVPANADTTMRGVIATLHDLGYRITRVEPDALTVSATRATTLRMAVVVRPKNPTESIVRANATIIAPLREAQVDSAEFYQQNFFVPLGATMARTLTLTAADDVTPEPVRPASEINTAKEREAAARAKAAPNAVSPPPPATPSTGAPR